MKHLISFFVMGILPMVTFAQSATILNNLILTSESSSADVQYNNEFGSHRNEEKDDPFPYVVVRIELEGDVAEAKRKITLNLGSLHKVVGIDNNKPNVMLFLIPDEVRMIYLECGDGCENVELYHGSLVTNKVYACRINYLAKKTESNDFFAELIEIRRQNDSIFNALRESSVPVVEEVIEPVLEDSIICSLNDVQFKMVLVKGGKFRMGSMNKKNEQPTHIVELKDYYIAETEVTQALWMAVMGYNPSRIKGDSLPVDYVNWNDCVQFLANLNSLLPQYYFDLPTEAQWEFAAREGVEEMNAPKFRFSGGNDLINLGWYEGNSGNTTHPVKSLRANALGIYDMTGNLMEWCKDIYGKYEIYDQYNPEGTQKGSERVIRGGSWDSKSFDSRTTSRYYLDNYKRSNLCGLRIVMKIQE